MPEQGNSEHVLSSAAVIGEDLSLPGERRRSRLIFGGPLHLRRAGEKEAFFLALICSLDMFTTLWWVMQGQAREANPLLSWTFQHHPVWFVIVKCLTSLIPIFMLTNLAQRRPQFTVWLMRAAIAAYIGVYYIGAH